MKNSNIVTNDAPYLKQLILSVKHKMIQALKKLFFLIDTGGTHRRHAVAILIGLTKIL